MKDPIVDSLNTIRKLESTQTLTENAAVAPVATTAAKGIGRFIPGVGAALGAYDAYGRAKQGDWKGAGLSALGGAAALIPGIGTAASIGIAGAQALRDKQRTGSYLPGDDEIAGAVAKDAADQSAQTTVAPTVSGANPKVLALQQQLIAKGAKIKADGVMGPATQTAMKQFPDVRMAETREQKGIEMSESENIAKLRDRLSQIESSPQTEGLADLAKGAYQGIKTIGKNLAGGARGDKARTAAGTYAAKSSAAGVANTVGKTAAANKGKIGLATGAVAGAAAAPAISNIASTSPTPQAANPAPQAANPAPATTAPATTAPATTAPATTAFDPADIAELNRLAAELETSNDPEDIAILQRYNTVINAINAQAKQP